MDSLTYVRLRLKQTLSELNGIKSVLPLFIGAADQISAASWATELQNCGFRNHSIEGVRFSLQVSADSDEYEGWLQD